MAVDLINPEGLAVPEAYAQLSVATGTRIVHISGQVARTASGETVGRGDLAAQTEQVFVNLATAVTAVGGTFQDVAKLTTYVTDWTPDKMGALVEGASRAAARLGFDPVRPITLIGVAALSDPDLLIEVDAVAVLP